MNDHPEKCDNPNLRPCPSFIGFGPGHQSKARCNKLGPHNQHRSSTHGLYWTTQKYSTAMDESPEEAIPEVEHTWASEEIKSLRFRLTESEFANLALAAQVNGMRNQISQVIRIRDSFMRDKLKIDPIQLVTLSDSIPLSHYGKMVGKMEDVVGAVRPIAYCADRVMTEREHERLRYAFDALEAKLNEMGYVTGGVNWHDRAVDTDNKITDLLVENITLKARLEDTLRKNKEDAMRKTDVCVTRDEAARRFCESTGMTPEKMLWANIRMEPCECGMPVCNGWLARGCPNGK